MRTAASLLAFLALTGCATSRNEPHARDFGTIDAAAQRLMQREGVQGMALAARLTPDQEALARSGRIGGTVAVEPDQYGVYSEGLKIALVERGLFDRVDGADRIENPTLIARIERYVHGTAVIPLWTFLSLGADPDDRD